MRSVVVFARRHTAALVLLVGIAWIVTVVLLIIANPEPGTGSPVR